jgi:hypothetical protein
MRPLRLDETGVDDIARQRGRRSQGKKQRG